MRQDHIGRAKTNRLLTVSAMFAAMITVTTAYLFHIPMGANGGYLHFGDGFIYLAACFLPAPYAMGAAAIGGGLADLLSGAPIWVLPTMIIKPLTAVWFTNKGPLFCRRNLFALVLAGLTSNCGYYLAEVIFSGSWLAPLATQWGGLIQSAGSGVVFIAVALALDKLHMKSRIGI